MPPTGRLPARYWQPRRRGTARCQPGVPAAGGAVPGRRGGDPADPRHRYRHPLRRERARGRREDRAADPRGLRGQRPDRARPRQRTADRQRYHQHRAGRPARPEAILAHPKIRALIDFSQPVALLLVAILHFIKDAENPARIVATLRDALPAGSYLALSHATGDFHPPGTEGRAASAYQKPPPRSYSAR